MVSSRPHFTLHFSRDPVCQTLSGALHLVHFRRCRLQNAVLLFSRLEPTAVLGPVLKRCTKPDLFLSRVDPDDVPLSIKSSSGSAPSTRTDSAPQATLINTIYA